MFGTWWCLKDHGNKGIGLNNYTTFFFFFFVKAYMEKFNEPPISSLKFSIATIASVKLTT